MKILFATAGPLIPALGGAQKITRIVAEDLAARGHTVRVMGLARTSMRRGATVDEFVAELATHGIAPTRDGELWRFGWGQLEVVCASNGLAVKGHVAPQIREFEPDVVVVVSEDWRQVLLEAALTEKVPVVYHAMTTTSLPMGPESMEPNDAGRALIARCAARIGLSRYLSRHLEEFGGGSAHTVYSPVYGAGPWPHFRNHEGAVLMFNPCVIKGLPIFSALAAAFPATAFIGVPTWGAERSELAELEALPNVELLAPSEDIDQFFARTAVLVVPSLWAEAFGLVVVEAMLRGIPVLASDVGGLPEAKLGTDFTLPVRPVRCRSRGGIPVVAESPEQDVGPWSDALRTLLSDRDVYRQHSDAARAAALEFVATTSVEQYLPVFDEALGRG